MNKRMVLFTLFSFLTVHAVFSQQRADNSIEITVEQPSYPGNGPTIAIDGGHNNFHTLDGRFGPFGRLMRLDGYTVQAIQSFEKEELEKIDVLVISNPLHVSNLGNWENPCPSAFTDEEIKTLRKWVQKGGRLLLIADHMPFGGAAQELAQAFGFDFANGFAMGQQGTWPPDTYEKSAGTLEEHPITEGIPKLAAFTGSAVKAPKKATVLSRFSEEYRILLPAVAWEFSEETPSEPGSEYVHSAIMKVGKGRIAVFSEAAMFTAQVANEGKTKIGFVSEVAEYNQQFIIQLMRWLVGS
jgi:hypothetical protein